MKKKNSIKRAQSQAGLSFAERKNFRPMAKLFTMLALLCLTATGAWAQTAFIMKEVTADMVPTTWNGDETTITVDDLPGFISVDKDAAKAWTGAPSDAYVTIFYSVNGTLFSELNYDKGNGPNEGTGS